VSSVAVARSVFGSVAASLVSAPVDPVAVATARAVSAGCATVRSSVRLGRAVLRLAALGGRPVSVEDVATARRGWVMGRRAGVSAARLAVLARVGRLLAAAVPFAGFVPAGLALGRSGWVPAARFLTVARGAVSGVEVSSSSVSCHVGGVRLVCLAAGLGGAAGLDSLVAALQAAEASGVLVRAVGAPNASGRVLGGFFCGITM